MCFCELAIRANSHGIEGVALCWTACSVECMPDGFGRLAGAGVGWFGGSGGACCAVDTFVELLEWKWA